MELLIYQNVLVKPNLDFTSDSYENKFIYLYYYPRDIINEKFIYIFNYYFDTQYLFIPKEFKVFHLNDTDNLNGYELILKQLNKLNKNLVTDEKFTEIINVNNIETRNNLVKEINLFVYTGKSNDEEISFYKNLLRTIPNTYLDIYYFDRFEKLSFLFLAKQITTNENLPFLDNYNYTKYDDTYFRNKDLLLVYLKK